MPKKRFWVINFSWHMLIKLKFEQEIDAEETVLDASVAEDKYVQPGKGNCCC